MALHCRIRLIFSNNSIIKVIRFIIVLLTVRQCQAQNSSRKGLREVPTDLIVNQCHYCDLCTPESFLEILPAAPPEHQVRNCSKELTFDEKEISCMTMLVHFIDRDNHNANKFKDDHVRDCVKNGTAKCLKAHIVNPNNNLEDGRCVKTTLSETAYASYLACNSAERIMELQEMNRQLDANHTAVAPNKTIMAENKTLAQQEIVEISFQTKTYRKPLREKNHGADVVEIVICMCTGKLCNNHRMYQLEDADYLDQGYATNEPGNFGATLHVTGADPVLGLIIIISQNWMSFHLT